MSSRYTRLRNRKGRNIEKCMRYQDITYRTCLGNRSDGSAIQLTEEMERYPSVTFSDMDLAHAVILTVQCECVCWKNGDIISTFTHEPPNIHLKAPGGQSPAQTHAAALLCAHANTHTHAENSYTLLHNRLWCHQHRTYIPLTHTQTAQTHTHWHEALVCTQRYQN